MKRQKPAWRLGLAVMLPVLAVLGTRAAVAQEQPQADPASPPPAQSPEPAGLPDTVATEKPPSEVPETEIVLKDGRRLSGYLVERSTDKIVIAIGGVPTHFSLNDIHEVRPLPSVEERYAQLRGSINDEDVLGLLQLSTWLYNKGRYELAIFELRRLLTTDPGNTEAQNLKALAEAQLKVVKTSKPQTEQERAARPPAPEPTPFPLLTDAQINIIRVFEVNLSDPPRMTITRPAIERFLDEFAGQKSVPSTREGRAAFFRLRPAKILETMFEVRARQHYGSVTVHDNPESMKRFRDDVLRGWIINSCATTQCHGGEHAGRLWLNTTKAGTDPSVYTNFIILDRFRTAEGLPLIDYTSPARSPLLHMGLPRENSLFPHPKSEPGQPQWRPTFRSADDDKFQRTIRWISSMYKPRPEYPVEYTPPVPAGVRDRQTTPVER